VTGWGGGKRFIPARAVSHKDQNIFEVVAHTYSMDATATDACPTYKVTTLVYQALTTI
jgi:hypothetical protein